MSVKKCARCKAPGPFGNNKSKKDGLDHYCVTCRRRYDRERYLASMPLCRKCEQRPCMLRHYTCEQCTPAKTPPQLAELDERIAKLEDKLAKLRAERFEMTSTKDAPQKSNRS